MAKKHRRKPIDRILSDAKKRPTSTNPEKYARSLAKNYLTKRKLSDAIERQKQYYADTLRPYAVPSEHGDTLLDLNDGWKPHCFSPDIPDDVIGEVRDAVLGMDAIYLLQWHAAKKRQPADVSTIAQCAFIAGYAKGAIESFRMLESFANLGFEADAGRRVPKGKLTAEEKAKCKVWFAKLKDSHISNNAAVLKLLRIINDNRPNHRVHKSTVERAVGIRK